MCRDSKFYCSRNQGREHCNSKVEMLRPAAVQHWLFIEGVFAWKCPSCCIKITWTQMPDRPHGELFVCAGQREMVRAPGLLCLLKKISVQPLPMVFLCLCVHRHAKDVEDLWYSFGFVLIKNSLSGEGINLELLGCASKMKETLLINQTGIPCNKLVC